MNILPVLVCDVALAEPPAEPPPRGPRAGGQRGGKGKPRRGGRDEKREEFIEYKPNDGFTFKDPDGKASLRIGAWAQPALVQYDLTGPFSPTGVIYRARMPIRAKLGSSWTLDLEPSWDEGKAGFEDIKARWDASDAVSLTFGHYRGASMIEYAISFRDQMFLDRSLVTELGLQRHDGLTVVVSPEEAIWTVRVSAMRPTIDEGEPSWWRFTARGELAPSDTVAIGLWGGSDLGDHGTEFESPIGTVLTPRTTGVVAAPGGGADLVVSSPLFRLVLEGATRADLQEGDVGGTHIGAAGLVGISPLGEDRDDAADGAAPEKGLEIVLGVETERSTVEAGTGHREALKAGLSYRPRKNVRLAGEATYATEQSVLAFDPVKPVGAAAYLVVGL